MRQADEAEKAMRKSIAKIEESIKNIKPTITSIWAPELKASDDVLHPILFAFFNEMNRPAQIQKAWFHELIALVKPGAVDKEIITVLDMIYQTALKSLKEAL